MSRHAFTPLSPTEPLPLGDLGLSKFSDLRLARARAVARGEFSLIDGQSTRRLKAAENVLARAKVTGLIQRRVRRHSHGPTRRATVDLVFTFMLMNAFTGRPMYLSNIWEQGLRLPRCRMNEVGFTYRDGNGRECAISYHAFVAMFHLICDALDISKYERVLDPESLDKDPYSRKQLRIDGEYQWRTRPEWKVRKARALMDTIVQRMLAASIGGDGDDIKGSVKVVNGRGTIDGTSAGPSRAQRRKAGKLKTGPQPELGWRRHGDNAVAELTHDAQTMEGQITVNGAPVILNFHLRPGHLHEHSDGADLSLRTAETWGLTSVAADGGFFEKADFRQPLLDAGLDVIGMPSLNQMKNPTTDPKTGIVKWCGNFYSPYVDTSKFPTRKRPTGFDIPRTYNDTDREAAIEAHRAAVEKWDATIADLDRYRLDVLFTSNSGKAVVKLVTEGGLCAGCNMPASAHNRPLPAPADERLAKVCGQVRRSGTPTKTITYAHQDRRENAPTQPHPTFSPEHIRDYKHSRALGEATYGIWKDPSGEDVSARRIRVRGLTAHTLMFLCWAVAYNLRVSGYFAKLHREKVLVSAYLNAPHRHCWYATAHADKTCDHIAPHVCNQPPDKVE